MVAAGCLALCSCVSIGRRFNPNAVKTIMMGKTRQADIEHDFGDPFRTGVDSGDTTWTYVDYHFGIFGPQRTTDLLVKFNSDGTVKSYAYNTNEEEPAGR